MYQIAVKRSEIARPGVLATQSISREERRYALWVFVFLVFFLAILSVWSRAKVVSLGYEISKESRRLEEMKEANERLNAQIAMLKAPGRLEPIARARLSLSPPDNNQIVLLK